MNPDSLHDAIMNLPIEAPDAEQLSDAELRCYRLGGRAARHAAAELVAAHPSAAPQGAQPAERSPKDYAIEHAEYMAQSAEHLLSMIEALSAAELHREETGEDDGAVHDARDVVWESVRGLHSHIYEFRKRKDRAAASPADAAPVPQAARDVLAERKRQVDREGWTPAHDDQHNNDELALAAACYAHPAPRVLSVATSYPGLPVDWPWDKPDWKPKDRRSNLVRAGALILAEIERLDRAAMNAGPTIPAKEQTK